MTTATAVAELFGNDGMNFTLEGGASLEDVCCQHHASLERGCTCFDENGNMIYRYDYSGDLFRYVFPDKSAIVISGGAWDVEGNTPFSWESAQ